MVILFLLACTTTENFTDTATQTVPWTAGLPRSTDTLRGFSDRRGIIHLHSPWSHDACDGDPLPEGAPDEDCLAALRDGLCTTAMDFAYLTDHPAHAAEQDWDALLLYQDGDELLFLGDAPIANQITCPDGHTVTWMPGIEDELMPLGHHHHAGDTPEENDSIYNASDLRAIEANQAAGALVFVAHTEGRTRTDLETHIQDGAIGVEIFNLHAMFDPSIRSEDLGLPSTDWMLDIQPFTDPDGTAEPDLLFLAVLAEQTPSISHWDALQGTHQVVGVAGTDAHQNVLPITLRDGERGDSYRRMMRWFSNHLLVQGGGTAPADLDEALAHGRLYVAFEALGTPTGLDVHITDSTGQTYEIGSNAPRGTLTVTCPDLSPLSPSGSPNPEISATVFKDGNAWQSGCGDFAVDEPGSYRVKIDITPLHLQDFLGEDPDIWMQPWPWIYTNPIAVY